MGASTTPRGSASRDIASEPVRVLLVEDDDGDALLVQDLLTLTGAPVSLTRVRTLAEALQRPQQRDGFECILLDLDLPDAFGLVGLRRLRETMGDVPVLVLTGQADEQRAIEAVAGGAQDYLVKGRVDGPELVRSIRYAVERRRAEDARQALEVARLHAAENARLERGLLPKPLVDDTRVRLTTCYRPGRRRMLLGGDFYDAVEAEDGVLHAVIGDVCGHGPDEAALGVCLRIAWRALVLARCPADQILYSLERIVRAERHDSMVFSTLLMASVAPDRREAELRIAGHPPPMLVAAGRAEALELAPGGPPLGVLEEVRCRPQTVALPEGPWSLLLYTDGLIEGQVDGTEDRLGSARLADKATALLASTDDAASIVPALVEYAESLHGGPLPDDVGALLLTYLPT
jgi:serine phosphatase RsbU (regulator of sigma subunit)